MSSRAFNIADHMKNLQGTRTLASGAKIVGADADSIQAPGLITSAGGGDNTSINSAIGSATGATFNGTVGSSATFPAGHIIQTVHGIGGNITDTHNGATWTTIETLATTITVNKGNKVLVMANGVNWYTSGTTNHNGMVRIRLSDGTNNGDSNVVLLWTQNFSIQVARMYGTSHSGMLTTASGSGTVVVTAYVQASTEPQGTVNYGDTNTSSSFGYILQEITV